MTATKAEHKAAYNAAIEEQKRIQTEIESLKSENEEKNKALKEEHEQHLEEAVENEKVLFIFDKSYNY